MDPNEKNNLDILDNALSGDDHDYGDNTAAVSEFEDGNEPEDHSALDQQSEVNIDDNDQQTITPEQSIAGQQPAVAEPGHVPNVSQDNPNNFKRVGAQFADGRGNIVDKDGKIIARAGESARHWQTASRAQAQVENLNRQMTVLHNERQQYQQIIAQAKEISELPQRLGVSKEDYTEGMTLMSKWKADPVAVAREIVARTLTFGYNVTDILGKNAGDALEMKAIAQLVQQSTAPIRQQAETESRNQQVQQQAEQQYNSFVAKYEHADVHADAIANMMNNGVQPVEAYFRVREFAISNGLDFTQPLAPQVAQMQQRQNGQRTTDPQRRTAPMVAGNGRGTQTMMTNEPAMASADDDWGSILRSAGL